MSVDSGTVPVLITRPEHQNARIMEMLQQQRFIPLSFPTIAIRASDETPFLRQLNEHIRDYDIALFVSRNAVDYAFRHVAPADLPDQLQLGVIGKGTLMALRAQGLESGLIPTGSYNSEGLLASETLNNISGKRVIIFRGQEGRNLLGETLSQRGASVDHVEVYRRELPNIGKQDFEQLCRDGFPAIAVFTSSEGLENCFHLLNDSQAEKMRRIDWLLISERMGETARNLRHNAGIIIAHSASDEGILSALLEWRHNKT